MSKWDCVYLYQENMDKALARTRQITERLAIFAAKNPREINWTQAGISGEIVETLDNLAHQIGIDCEYGEFLAATNKLA